MKRLNNKILLIVLVVLLGGFLVSKMFRTPALESNLPTDLFGVDTTKITEVHVNPEVERGEIKLVRHGEEWSLQKGDKTADPELALIKNALGGLQYVRPTKMMSRRKEKWSEYKVDSTGTHVQVYDEDEVLADWWIGKAGSGEVYVRLNDKEDVYAIRGMMRNYFNKGFNDWRDKTFIRIEPDTITKITFQYPVDTGFVVAKADTLWTINGQPADPLKVSRYLNTVQYKSLTEFADNFSPVVSPDVTIVFESNGVSMQTVQAWKQEEDRWIMGSSGKQGIYFSNEGSTIIKDLFQAQKDFQSGSE